MTVRPIVLVLPCHSLDDFPTHHEGEEAAGLLASWTAPWHPAWIAARGTAPEWISHDAADSDRLRDAIVLTPRVVDSFLANDFDDRVRDAGADRLKHFPDRQSLLAALGSLQGAGESVAGADAVAPELVSDFQSLGFWYLQIEILSRQVSYHSNLDDHRFRELVVQAARHAVAGDRESAVESLQMCFGLLTLERDHYYPVDAYLVDLVLVGPSSSAQAVADEIRRSVPVNLWMTGAKLNALHAQSPETISELTHAMENGRLALIGGELSEPCLPLLTIEALRRQWVDGLAAFKKVLGVRPRIWFRRRCGLTPRLAEALRAFGWTGAVHATLDAGHFPAEGQPCACWQDRGAGQGIPALRRVPLDANQPGTFLRLARTMGSSMESDYVATICLARWAGRELEWMDDVRRGAGYDLHLGKFVTCEKYFEFNQSQVHADSRKLDAYRSAYLQQAVDAKLADPISRWVQHWRGSIHLEAAERLASLASVMDPDSADPSFFDELQSVGRQLDTWDALGFPVITETAPSPRPPTSATDPEATPGLAKACQLYARAAQRLAQAVASPCDSAEQKTPIAGWLLTHPFSHPGRGYWAYHSSEVSVAHPGDQDTAIHALHVADDGFEASVDVPAWGLAWLPSAARDAEGQSMYSGRGSMVERLETGGILMQNEFLSVTISERSGGISAIFDFHSRGNRLSQRLVRVFGKEKATDMVCDALEVLCDTPLRASVKATGRLVGDEDRVLGHFEQTVSLVRGTRIADVQVRLDRLQVPTGKPWTDHVACRWAWPHETDELVRGLQSAEYPTQGRRCESPWMFEIRDGKRRTALITGGLPFHHRHAPCQLDSLLVCAGESRREFTLAIGVDLPHTLLESESHWIAPSPVPCVAPGRQAKGWLFHISSQHVVITGCWPVWQSAHQQNDGEPDDGEADNVSGGGRSAERQAESAVAGGRCVGVRVRLQEQSGSQRSFRLRGPRPWQSAEQMDLVANRRAEVAIDAGAASITIGPHEWIEVVCRW